MGSLYVPDDVHGEEIGYHVVHIIHCSECMAYEAPARVGLAGRCRRRAPHSQQTTVTTTTWPRTAPTDWCAEGVPKPPELA